MPEMRSDWLALSVIAMLAAAGCNPSEPTTAAKPPQPAPTPPAGEAPTTPAESGLEMKRGVMLVGAERTTFQPCGENNELWVLDQTDGVLQQNFAAKDGKQPTVLYVEAYGERTQVTDDVPQARGFGGVLVLEQVLYAAVQGEGKGCAAPAPDYIVAARGNEPGWSAEVRDAQIVWRQAEAPRELTLSAPQTEDAEGAVRYRASGADHDIEVLIESQACRDTMSDEFFAYSARAVLDGREFSGCARIGK